MRILNISKLAAGLLVGCAPAHVVTTPAPTPGAGELIRYADVTDSSEFIVGRLVSVDADRLVVQRFVTPSLFRPEIGSSGEWVRDSISTASIARLQVHVGRRGNGIRGAIIGTIVGATIGVMCANEPGGVGAPSDEACFLGYTLFGTGIGWLIGSLRHSDVWAPAPLPDHREAPGIVTLESCVVQSEPRKRTYASRAFSERYIGRRSVSDLAFVLSTQPGTLVASLSRAAVRS